MLISARVNKAKQSQGRTIFLYKTPPSAPVKNEHKIDKIRKNKKNI
jgi:hypothetical protein